MVSGRSHTAMHRGLVKVRKARIVVMMLLIMVAVAIVLIDKNEQEDAPVIAQQQAGVNTQPTLTDGATILDEVATAKPEENKIVAAPKVMETKEQIITPIKPAQTVEPNAIVKADDNPVFTQSTINVKKSPRVEYKRRKTVRRPKTRRNKVYKAGNLNMHVVRKGESFSTLAQKYYGKSSLWIALFKANRDTISHPRLLRAGQKVKLPSMKTLCKYQGRKSRRVSPKSRIRRHRFVATRTGKARLVKGSYHCVVKGETLSGIAKRSGVRFLKLYDLNKKVLRENPHRLKPGLKIWIPKASANN